MSFDEQQWAPRSGEEKSSTIRKADSASRKKFLPRAEA
jgi:hypothetical protein